MNESNVIDYWRRLAAQQKHPWLTVGIGDDAAVTKAEVMAGDHDQLICSDMLMDGIHFRCQVDSLGEIGRKCLAVNLSDIAAMGGTPQLAFVSLALPRDWSRHQHHELFLGISRCAEEFEVAIAGGDTNFWSGPLVVSITVVGRCHPHGACQRGHADVNDVIMVTGALGDSFASGHHLNFRPRIREAQSLMDHGPPSAMIDISDGLGKDLPQLLGGDLGAILLAESLPRSQGLWGLPDAVQIQRVMEDGEDFELCFTAPPELAQRFTNFAQMGFPVYVIGEVKSGRGILGQWANGMRQPWEFRGFVHS